MLKVGVVGGTGYTGVELLRLLVGHSKVAITSITSRSECDVAVADIYPNLRRHLKLRFSEPKAELLTACDLVFFATPTGTAMTMAPELLDAGVRVIDLAADFRLKDAADWERWYGIAHTCPDLLKEAVYGLPELNRSDISEARLVANPGCYPTAVALGFLPLIEQGMVVTASLIADAKSGVSGAGRKPSTPSLMGECGESFKAYAASGHRHLPEIQQTLTQIAGEPVRLTFVPHLVPMIRGIEATLYARVATELGDLQALYEGRYRNEPFVDVMPFGSHPETRSVRGVNDCRLALHHPDESDTVVVLSVIDNLVKGAAGQAIQNMNLMFGFEETEGLRGVALLP